MLVVAWIPLILRGYWQKIRKQSETSKDITVRATVRGVRDVRARGMWICAYVDA